MLLDSYRLYELKLDSTELSLLSLSFLKKLNFEESDEFDKTERVESIVGYLNFLENNLSLISLNEDLLDTEGFY